MKEKKAAAVAAFQTAIQKVERKHGHSLRKMCKIAGVSEHAAGRAARGDIKRRINADVLAGFRQHFPEFDAAYDAAIG